MPRIYPNSNNRNGGRRNQQPQDNVNDALNAADGEVKRVRIVIAHIVGVLM